MNKLQLDKILRNHELWLRNENCGERADLYEASLSGADLSEANLSRASLSGADLSEADLSGADLSGADLSEADLSEANLSRASLSGADLSEANLSEADLSEADLSGAEMIIGPQRADGYRFLLVKQTEKWQVVAGCRSMTIGDYREHIKTYNDKRKSRETTLIINYLEAQLELKVAGK